MLFETRPAVTWSFPVAMTSFPVHPGCHGNISGPVTSFPVLASIPCSAELSVPVPKNRPRGQTGHVGQIRLSDWLKFEMLASDWLPGKPTPFTTKEIRRTRRKALRARQDATTNPTHMWQLAGDQHQPQWWETSVLATALSLFPIPR